MHVKNNDKFTITLLIDRCNSQLYNKMIIRNQLQIIQDEDPKTIFINDSDLYRIIMRGNSQVADHFQYFITSEVLPLIRKFELSNINNNNTNINNNDDYNNNDNNNYYENNLDKYNNKDCIYILHIRDNLYKFGKTSHLKNRLTIHKKKLQYINIVKIYICKNMNIMTK